MNIDELITQLESPDIKLINQTILDSSAEGRNDYFIDGLCINSQKILNFNFLGKIVFQNCHFSQIHIASNLNLEFNNCSIDSMEIDNGKIGICSDKEIKNIWGTAFNSLIISNSNNIGKITLPSPNKKLFQTVNIHDCTVKDFILEGNHKNSMYIKVVRTTFQGMSINLFDVMDNHGILFFHCQVQNILSCTNSNLKDFEFSSCDFSKSYLIIDNANVELPYYRDIRWFKKIYEIRKRAQKRFILDLIINKKVVNKFSKIKFLGIGRKMVFFKRREYYEVYRQYKLLMSKLKNRPDEIYFKSKEYNAKFTQLKWLGRDFFDKLNLLLNKWSNNHGRFWIVPIIWIFALGALFFNGFINNTNLSTIENNGWSLVIDNYTYGLQFLNPTHKLDMMGGDVELYNAAVVYDWLFRIISAYLIFQTITAFRKYKE